MLDEEFDIRPTGNKLELMEEWNTCKDNSPPHDVVWTDSDEQQLLSAKEDGNLNGFCESKKFRRGGQVLIEQVDRLCLEDWSSMNLNQLRNECKKRDIMFRSNFLKATLIRKLENYEGSQK